MILCFENIEISIRRIAHKYRNTVFNVFVTVRAQHVYRKTRVVYFVARNNKKYPRRILLVGFFFSIFSCGLKSNRIAAKQTRTLCVHRERTVTTCQIDTNDISRLLISLTLEKPDGLSIVERRPPKNKWLIIFNIGFKICERFLKPKIQNHSKYLTEQAYGFR